MTPLRIGDCVSVGRHERKTSSSYLLALSFSFFLHYTWVSTLRSFSLVTRSPLPSTWALYLFSPLYKVHRDFDVTRDLLLLIYFYFFFTASSSNFSLAYFIFLLILFLSLGESSFFGVASPQWTHLGACHALITDCLSLSAGWQIHQLLVH